MQRSPVQRAVPFVEGTARFVCFINDVKAILGVSDRLKFL